MQRRTDVPSRGEVTECTDKSREDMQEKEEELDVTATDVETIRQTLEELEPGGTTEGSDEVEASIERADDATMEVFDDQDEELEEIQDDSKEHEGEIQDLSDTNDENLGKLSDASGQMETDAAISEFRSAKDAAMHDAEFLGDEIRKVEEVRQESERAQQDYQNRVRSRNGG